MRFEIGTFKTSYRPSVGSVVFHKEYWQRNVATKNTSLKYVSTMWMVKIEAAESYNLSIIFLSIFSTLFLFSLSK